MKKIFSMALILLSGIVAMTSCSEDRDDNPLIQTPTEFVLNTPALSDQYIQLSETNNVNLTWSQPDYGYNALATYMIQVGLVENGTVKWNETTDENGVTTPVYISKEPTVCSADVSGEEIAQALCSIDGITDKDNYVDMGFREVAFRVVSTIRTTAGNIVDGTTITSNTVTFKHMAGYCAIKSAAYIYIIGDCGGWTEPAAGNADKLADWRLFETEIGSNVFQGSKYISAGKFQLRFYSALTGWDGGASIGAQESDNAVTISLTDNVYSGECVAPGKGSWQIDEFPGGYVTFTVDMNQKLVTFEYTGDEQAELPTGSIYLVGAPSGWTEPIEDNAASYTDWKLNSYESTGAGIYTGTFDIPSGSAMFRFYSALTGWDGGASIGAQEADENVDITLTDNVYSGTCVAPGKGNWNIPDWTGGKLKMVVNTNDNTVTFTKL